MSKIMVLEDDPTMLSLLRTLLEIEGFQVTHTLEFEKAPEIIREERPDIILLDVNLRNVSGLDLISEIRGDESIEDMIVIMSSGMDLRDECMKKGASDFILKPYMPDELVRKIKGFVKD